MITVTEEITPKFRIRNKIQRYLHIQDEKKVKCVARNLPVSGHNGLNSAEITIRTMRYEIRGIR